MPFECAGVTCPAGRCVNGGTCLPSTCASLGCAPGLVCQAGACLHPLCVGKVFFAGIVGPRADLNQFESLLAANVNGAWTRLNVTALPKVRQLVFSLDGSWLFAVGEDDSLRRSQDGVTWQTGGRARPSAAGS